MQAVLDRDPAVTTVPAGLQERRRPGRMANPSPELIALMRKPTEEARRQLALYDAPNFVLPQPARVRANPAHTMRMVCAASLCVGAWGGMFTAMMMAWG